MTEEDHDDTDSEQAEIAAINAIAVRFQRRAVERFVELAKPSAE